MSEFMKNAIDWAELDEPALAQAGAMIALAEQQRIANLIALAGLRAPDGSTPFFGVIADGAGMLKPDVEKALLAATRESWGV